MILLPSNDANFNYELYRKYTSKECIGVNGGYLKNTLTPNNEKNAELFGEILKGMRKWGTT